MVLEIFKTLKFSNVSKESNFKANQPFLAFQIPCKTRVELGSPGEAICQVAKDEQVTCILLGNRGLGAFRRTILGSVSDHVVHHSRVPVIIVPPKEH